MGFSPRISEREKRTLSVTTNRQLLFLFLMLLAGIALALESGNTDIKATTETVVDQQTCTTMLDGTCVTEDVGNNKHDSDVNGSVKQLESGCQDGSKSSNYSSVNTTINHLTEAQKYNAVPSLPVPDEDGYVETEYGEPQFVADEEAKNTRETHSRFVHIHDYMYSVVYVKGPSYIRNLCRNRNEFCTYWASIGECESNPAYMSAQCAPACFMCDKLSIPPVPVADEEGYVDTGYGDYQLIITTDEQTLLTQRRLAEMHEYMHSDVYANEPESIKDQCLNQNEECTLWASTGECENSPAYMELYCAPACFSCDKLIFENRCPLPDNLEEQNIWKPGDLNRMFENILTNPYYQESYGKINVILRPGMNNAALNDSPWVITIDDFLTFEECDVLIKLGGNLGYERSKDIGTRLFDGTYSAVKSSGRASSNAWCQEECSNNTATQNVLRKIENLTGIPEENSEALQLLRYEVGEFYEVHHDYTAHHLHREQGVRIMTVFLYLNDVEAGGGTNFPILDVTVMPKRGRALLWPSVTNDDPNRQDYRTDHQALPVEKGVKYGANAWIHLRNFKAPHARNCN